MSQEAKDYMLTTAKYYFNSKPEILQRTRRGSSQKEQKIMIIPQYEEDYKDLAFQLSNNIQIEPKQKDKNCSGDTYDFKTKWKTEICHYWEVNGRCKYGDNCAFAHGDTELRNRKMSSSYKTKECKRFFEIGYCPYGSRCQFSHSKQGKNKMSYFILLSNLINNGNSDTLMMKRPRLKTFENLNMFNSVDKESNKLNEGKTIEAFDYSNSIDTKDNDKEENTEPRERYLSV